MPHCTATILGSGTSHGVPMIGVTYPDSFLSNPKNHRYRCSVHLQSPTGSVLVDCAPEMRLQVLREEITRVDSVIITHTHADHIMGMDDLRAYCDLQNQDMNIYTLAEHFDDIKRIFPYAFRTPHPGLTYPRFCLNEVESSLNLGGMDFQFFTVVHGATNVVAMRIGSLGYMTDVKHVPAVGYEIMTDVETLVVDGLRPRPHPTHFNFEEAIRFGTDVGARRTILTHLTHDCDHDLTCASLPPGFELAFDGMKIPFSC